jgi:maltose alpha-D-glucosyltransferase/alpha-amylase
VQLQHISDYFGEGNRMQVLFHFLLNNRLFVSLAAQDAAPLARYLREGGMTEDKGTWVNFIRTHDELDLDQTTDEEREAVFAAFAPEGRMRIYGRGIRRRLPPMLKGDQRRIRMAYSLLFALPGVPLILYGEEIGMGEDLDLEGRTSVRLPMQWNGQPGAGFSKADPDTFITPVLSDGPFGYKKVNVAAQAQDTHSLLQFFRRLIAVRRQWPAIGDEVFEAIDAGNPAVLALCYQAHGDKLYALHNVSDKQVEIKMPEAAEGEVIFGQDSERQLLPAYGYRWIHVKGDTHG